MGNVNSSSSSRASNGSSSRGSKKSNFFKKPLPLSESANARLVESKWCNALNNYDVKTIKNFASTDSICIFKGAKSGMPLSKFLEEVENIFKAFPDNQMRWESIEEIAPGKVKVTNFVGRGTHTGTPFGFGPFPPIPATGIVVEEDPCHLIITVTKGKMTKFVIDTYCGDLVGPPGYYQKIGGSYVAQPSN